VQRITNEKANDTKTYYQYDAKGNVIGQQTKEDSTLHFKISYNDYGKPNRDLNNEYGYNGEVHDYNGTQYLRARYYNTNTGRFDQRDSYMGEYNNPISQNRYTYVWNSPNQYMDRSGNWPSINGIIGAVAGAISGAVSGAKAGWQTGGLFGAAIGVTTGARTGAVAGYQAGSATPKINQAWGAGWTSGGAAGSAAGNAAGTTISNGGSYKEAENAAELAGFREVYNQRVRLEEEANTIEQELQALGIDTSITTDMSVEQRVRYLREYKRICDELSANEKFEPTKANEEIAEWVVDDQKSFLDKAGEWWDENGASVIAGTLIFGGVLAFTLVTGGMGVPSLLISGKVVTGATFVKIGATLGGATIFSSAGTIAYANKAYEDGKISIDDKNTLINGAMIGSSFAFNAVITGLIYLIGTGEFSSSGGSGGNTDKDIGVGKNYKYSQSILDKADDLYHDFPVQLDDFVLENSVLNRPDGRIEYLAHGSVNGTDGVYHITTRGDLIIHRAFIPVSDWARFANVNGLPPLSGIPPLN